MVAEELIRGCDAILRRHGVVPEDPILLSLDDTDLDADPEPAEISSFDAALQKLLEWPTLGSLSYVGLSDIGFDVGFVAHSDVWQVWIGFTGRAFEADRNPEALPAFVAIAKELHKGLGSLRTSFDYGLADAYDEVQEAERLTRRVVSGRPWLDILGHELVTPEVLQCYRQRLGPTAVLRTGDDGSLFFQRNGGRRREGSK